MHYIHREEGLSGLLPVDSADEPLPCHIDTRLRNHKRNMRSHKKNKGFPSGKLPQKKDKGFPWGRNVNLRSVPKPSMICSILAKKVVPIMVRRECPCQICQFEIRLEQTKNLEPLPVGGWVVQS